MSYNINLEKWVNLFAHYAFQSPDFDTYMRVGWVGWDCEMVSVKNKTIKLGKILEKILPSKKLQPSEQYVCFNSYLNKEDEKTYDEIFICSVETKEILWTVAVTENKVYHCSNCFEAAVFSGKTTGEIVKWFIKGRLKGYEKLNQ